jgi:sphinganine-1-phosphate aldolase
MLSLPSSKAKIASEMAKTRAQLREKILSRNLPDGVALTTTKTLPEQGRSREWLENEWANLRKLDGGPVVNGQVSGTVYHVCFASGSRLTRREGKN